MADTVSTPDIAALKARIQALEPAALGLDSGDGERRLSQVAAIMDYTSDYREHIRDRKVYEPFDPAGFHAADLQFTEAPEPIDAVMHQFDRSIMNGGVHLVSPRFFGFIPSGGIYAGALGDFLAASTNRYAGVEFSGPGVTRCERELVRWLAAEVGYPDGAGGDLTSGGSIANLSAVITARQAAGLRSRDYERAVVYVTSLTHHSLSKALHIAGLGEASVRQVPMDAGYRMDAAALRAQIDRDRADGHIPWLLGGTAGTTDLGSIDPLEELADIAAEKDLWFHADGAYGGAFVLCAEGRRRLRGFERADSLIIDPHKGLFLPFGSGLVLVRDGASMHRAFEADAPYLQDLKAGQSANVPSAADISPELTRPFRGLRLWLSLKLYGLAAFRAALEEKLYLAEYFHQRLQAMDGYDMGPYPQLSITAFRYVPEHGDADAFNRRLADVLRADGRLFLSTTTIAGHFVLRFAVLGYNTHLDDIELAIDIITDTVRRLEAGDA